MPAHGHSVDEYLEVIYFLAFPIGEYRPAGESAIASRVADMLGVSRASAGEMLKRLEAEGLVERGEQKEAILTPAGIERAEKASAGARPHVAPPRAAPRPRLPTTDPALERIERAQRNTMAGTSKPTTLTASQRAAILALGFDR